MTGILLAEQSLVGRDAPVNAKAGIKDADTTIRFRMVELITLVLEDGCLGEDFEPVGKTTRNEKLEASFSGYR